MVGSRVVVVMVAVVAVMLPCKRAAACITVSPPPGLVGIPAPGEKNVPTDIVPVFSYTEANTLDETRLGLASFELVSASGTVVPVTAQGKYVWQFELVPQTALEPATDYTIHATVPPPTGTTLPTVALSLSFTTGDGPLTGVPAPPSAAIQHYHSTGTTVSSCGPGPDGSCIFFPLGTALVLDEGDWRYLITEPWWTNLSGVNQGTPWACVTLRTRAADGTLSDPLDVCRDDAESFTIPDLVGLECTENGLTKDGVPLAGAGGAGPTGGTGGTDAGGTGNSAGAPEPDPDDPGSRTIVTEGCGCRVPAPARGGSGAWLALGLALLAMRRRRT